MCMESPIEKGTWDVWKEHCFTDSGEQLFEVVEKWKWKELEKLFQWYFSLIDDLKCVNNVEEFVKFSCKLDDYNNEFNEILEFSKLQFMERTAWRKTNSGVEYCGAHLRNLLSPFKNLIGILTNCSEWDKYFKLIKNKLIPSCEENKSMILNFCEFLDKNIINNKE